MGMLHSTVTIIENQVVFSKEILEYFESLRNEETNEWVDKYIEVLSDVSNFDATKYNIHHIKPVFTFKTDELNTRKKAEKIANKFNGNMIKLSIYNHILAHFYLWKIYNNYETKNPLNYLFNTSKTIDELTEDELKIVAKLTEDVAKTNLTEEEKKENLRKYTSTRKDKNRESTRKSYRKHREKRLAYNQEYQKTHKELISENGKKWREKNKEYRSEYDKNYYKTHKEERKQYKELHKEDISQYHKDRDSRLCLDPITNLPTTFGKLRCMYKKHEEYKEVDAKKCLITEDLEYYEKLYNNLLQEKENERNNIKRNIRYDERCARPCKDPRYNSEYNIKSKNEITEFTTWGVLYFWATRNKNHPLLNGLSCAEWTNQFLLTPIEPKLFQRKKDSICKDPRYNVVFPNRVKKGFKFTEYTTYEVLRSWAKQNPNHPLVNNMSPSKWATQFILTPQELEEYKKTHSIK